MTRRVNFGSSSGGGGAEFPSGGEDGDFLAKDGTGVEWVTPPQRNIRGGRPGDSYAGGLTINGGAPGE